MSLNHSCAFPGENVHSALPTDYLTTDNVSPLPVIVQRKSEANTSQKWVLTSWAGDVIWNKSFLGIHVPCRLVLLLAWFAPAQSATSGPPVKNVWLYQVEKKSLNILK